MSSAPIPSHARFAEIRASADFQKGARIAQMLEEIKVAHRQGNMLLLCLSEEMGKYINAQSLPKYQEWKGNFISAEVLIHEVWRWVHRFVAEEKIFPTFNMVNPTTGVLRLRHRFGEFEDAVNKCRVVVDELEEITGEKWSRDMIDLFYSEEVDLPGIKIL